MSESAGKEEDVVEEVRLIDPVCGMNVSADSRHHFVHDGRNFYFCCARCLDRFSADPQQFLQQDEADVKRPLDANILTASRVALRLTLNCSQISASDGRLLFAE